MGSVSRGRFAWSAWPVVDRFAENEAEWGRRDPPEVACFDSPEDGRAEVRRVEDRVSRDWRTWVGALGYSIVFLLCFWELFELIDRYVVDLPGSRRAGRIVSMLIGGAAALVYMLRGYQRGLRRILRDRLAEEGTMFCPKCGYCLKGIEAKRCPECGAAC
jgi:hypothetical protein